MLTMGSCHDSLLSPDPESVLNENNYYKTANDMNLAVLTIYNSLQTRKRTEYRMLEIVTDNLYVSRNTLVEGSPEMDMLAVSATNPQVASYWESNYSGIFRANAVLANIDKPVNYKTGEKEQYEAEARFMRAFFYFDMVRLYGGVPKVTTLLTVAEAQQVGRSPENEIYGLIIADLEDAAKKLPLKNAIATGRATKAAAIALLAKVYVYRKEWAKANALFNSFDTDFGASYRLLPDFANLWKLDHEDNEEVIFAMKYTDGTNGHNLSTDFIPNGGLAGVLNRGNEVALPSWSLLKQYEKEDSRKAATITERWRAANRPTDPLVWYPFVSKYAVPHTPEKSGLDLPVIRYADVVLLQAETLYALGRPAEALAALNKVRERAFKSSDHNYTLADIPNADAFTDLLLKERQLEFAYECERWFDLARTGRFMTVMQQEERYFNESSQEPVTVKLSPKPHMKLLPVPQRQIDQSAPGVLTQNEGY
jgi:hypothetical protein